MASVGELLQLAQFKRQQNMENNPLHALAQGIGGGIQNSILQQQKQRNLQEQAETFQKLFQASQQTTPKTDLASTQKVLGNESVQKNRGVTDISRVIPTRSVSFDDSGNIKTKIGFRNPTPQEIKSRFDLQQEQEKISKSRRKDQALDSFIERKIGIQELVNQSQDLGITPDEIKQAQNLRAFITPESQEQGGIETQDIQSINVKDQAIKRLAAKGQPEQRSETPIPRFQRDITGQLTEEGKSQQKLFEAQEKDRIKSESGIKTGQRAALSNIDLISGAFRELSETYADAFEEGGVGNIGRAKLSDAAEFVGGDIGDNFSATAALPGQLIEVTSRVMPLLTQQGEKPGSVRLVATVFDKLVTSFPDKKDGPKVARRKMEQTLKNMFRFARAAQRIGLDNETVESLPGDELEELSNKVAEIAQTVEIVGKEKEQLDNLISSALEPVDNIIKKRSEESLGEETTNALESGFQEGDTATNPQTGEKLIFKSGRWVPING